MVKEANWQTFGHEPIKEIIDKQLKSEIFPHAYLFAGSEGVGKLLLAKEFAKKVLKTENLENHPDFQILDAEGEITMEMALDFIGKLGFKPFFGTKKIAVINNAQNLNQKSSNALLKTLEEPSESTIIILIANSARLLPTILSRCQIFNFNGFSKALLKQFAELQKLKISNEIVDLSFGSPAKLFKLVSDKDFLSEELNCVKRYQALVESSTGEKLVAINSFSDIETDELNKNFRLWLLWQNSQLSANPKDYSKVQALMEASVSLRTNKNKKLVLQELFLKI